MDPDKKISFSFSKSTKKPLVTQNKPVVEKKVELIECLEGQSIKIKRKIITTHILLSAKEEIIEPLVIPMKNSKMSLIDRIQNARALQKESADNLQDNRPDSELTIEEVAARELLKEAQSRLSGEPTKNVVILPSKEESPFSVDEPEPTLDDYEKVPITDYGMAVLRGMGWKEGMTIGKNAPTSKPVKLPELRPKGLGLGATRMLKAEIPADPARDKEGNALVLKKGVYAKIIAGSHTGEYCEVQGFDDEAGRVIVRTALKGDILTINEYLIVVVSNEEYVKNSKVLNNAKFEKYKNNSENQDRSEKNVNKIKSESSSNRKYKGEKEKQSEKHRGHTSSSADHEKSSSRSKEKHNKHKSKSSHRSKDRTDSDNSGSESRRGQKEKYRNSEAHKSKDQGDKKRHKSDYDRKETHRKNTSRSRYSSSSSSSSSERERSYRKKR
ncbi:hypothetical protein NQ317_004345 [Molorchus minor]|uniref:G-patch domain-containing protein n=1 Tax=Molorchus minor TaxID=1323400 RepID=A0ABQ9J2B1_9CUCU|nr:hypothetical protein NQ317_004345 [Molorchus minor]